MDHDDRIALGSIMKGAGRHMARDRYQEGRIALVGKRVKKWCGHFYVYEKLADGREHRRHRNLALGLKSQNE